MNKTSYATLTFRDDLDDQSNPIMSIVIAHSSLRGRNYENPDTTAPEPFSLFTWSRNHPGDFKSQLGGFYSTNSLMINKDQHDVWAVAFQRKKHRYVEYLQQKEGFWKKLEEGVVKTICNAAIEVADLFDDETSTPILTHATDKVIHEMFTHGDGDVIIENWVHWKSKLITFRIGKDRKDVALIHSEFHDTQCDAERFGNQSEMK